MIWGYDERCAADLASVGEGRDLSRADRAWLARVVTGAVRPNRDRPLWDLAHALAALARAAGARDGRDLVSLALDPGLAAAAALEARFAGSEGTDARGLVLDAGWRTGWAGLARSLALAEFVLTAEDLAQFAAVTGWLDELAAAPGPEGAAFLGKRLARHLAAYRSAHLPLAPLERRFRALIGFLGGRRAFADDDILAFWRAEMAEGERPGFRTVAEHLVTFEAGAQLLGGLERLSAPASLDAHAGWEERLDAALAGRAGALAAHLARMLRIAAALRIPERDGLAPEARAALEAAEADLRRVRRAGFDDRAALAAGFAAAEGALLRLAEEAERLERALGALARQRPLEAAFAADRAVFAEALVAAYAGEVA